MSFCSPEAALNAFSDSAAVLRALDVEAIGRGGRQSLRGPTVAALMPCGAGGLGYSRFVNERPDVIYESLGVRVGDMNEIGNSMSIFMSESEASAFLALLRRVAR